MSVSADRLRLLRRQAGQADVPAPAKADDGDALHDAPAVDAQALAELRASLDEMRIEIDAGRKPLDQDRRFHTIIAEQSGNSVLARLVAELFDERHSPISAQLRVKFEDRQTWKFALDEHEAILAALQNRDPLLAQAALRTHLECSRRRWTED